jgi:hypothetical protein
MPWYSADVEKTIETSMSWPPCDEQRAASKKLLQYISGNRPAPPQVPSEVQCAIVLDSGSDCLVPMFKAWLPPELQETAIARVCDHLSSVAKILRESAPALLITHSNLFVGSGEEAISALVAVSPGTRYLVVTAVLKFTENFRSLSDILGVPIDVLEAPFPREQFVTAVQKLCS